MSRKMYNYKILILFSVLFLMSFSISVKAEVISLEQAVQTAIENNHHLKAKKLDVEHSKKEKEKAKTHFLPQFTFSQSAERGDEPSYVFSRYLQQGYLPPQYLLYPQSIGDTGAVNNFNTHLRITQLIWAGGAVRAAVKEASAGERATAAIYNYERERTSAQVARSYLEVIRLKKQMIVLEQTEKALKAALKKTKDLYEQGFVVNADVLRVEVQLKDVQKEKIALKNAITLARYNLARQMGIDGNNPPDVVDGLSQFKILPLKPLGYYLKQVEVSHPIIKALKQQQKAAGHEIRRRIADFLPKFGAVADYQWNRDTSAHRASGYVVGLSLKWEIGDGLSRHLNVVQARIKRNQVEEQLYDTKDKLKLSVRKAWLDIQTSKKQIDVASTEVKQATESFKVALDRFSNGLTTVDDMLGTEAILKKARSDYVSALTDYAESYIELGLAVGRSRLFIKKVQQELLK